VALGVREANSTVRAKVSAAGLASSRRQHQSDGMYNSGAAATKAPCKAHECIMHGSLHHLNMHRYLGFETRGIFMFSVFVWAHGF
jgi:hypothetical protein